MVPGELQGWFSGRNPGLCWQEELFTALAEICSVLADLAAFVPRQAIGMGRAVSQPGAAPPQHPPPGSLLAVWVRAGTDVFPCILSPVLKKRTSERKQEKTPLAGLLGCPAGPECPGCPSAPGRAAAGEGAAATPHLTAVTTAPGPYHRPSAPFWGLGGRAPLPLALPPPSPAPLHGVGALHVGAKIPGAVLGSRSAEPWKETPQTQGISRAVSE